MTDTGTVISAKLVVAGAPGCGTSSFIDSVSELERRPPARASTADVCTTEPTRAGVIDVGRMTISDRLIVHLLGAPSQESPGFPWDDLAGGALGAVVLVDSRRRSDPVAAVDCFRARAIPFVVAVNVFDQRQPPELQPVRAALELADETVVTACDARDRESVKAVLLTLTDVVLGGLGRAGAAAPLENV